mgnify:CR=1 FL=1
MALNATKDCLKMDESHKLQLSKKNMQLYDYQVIDTINQTISKKIDDSREALLVYTQVVLKRC